MKRKWRAGFILMETVITVGLIALIAAFTAPFALKFAQTRAFDEQVDKIVSVLVTARDQSLLGKNGKGFGVKFFPNRFVLFEGASYAARVTTKDETFALPAGVSVNQGGVYPDEIAFSAATGGTITGITATVEIKRDPFTRTVFFNAYGALTTAPDQIGTLNAYWKFDELSGIRYSSVGSYNLAPISTDTGYATGKINKALKMTTGAPLRNLGGTLGNANRDFTVAGWFNLSSPPTVNLISGIVDQANALTWTIKYDQIMNRFAFVITNTTIAANAFGAPNIGTWYFIAASYDATAKIATIRVNNGATNTAIIASTPQNGIGVMTANNGGNDQIDELGIWAKVLTNTEIATLYNNGAGMTSPFTGTLADSAVADLPPVTCKVNTVTVPYGIIGGTAIRYPLSVVNDTTTTLTPWNNATEARFIDGIGATIANAISTPVITRTLQFRNFKNATTTPPDTADNARDIFNQLDGIVIDLRVLNGVNAQDSLIRIVRPGNGGATSSVNKAIGNTLSMASPKTVRYGDATDKWGLSWNNNDTNAINADDTSFGFDFSAKLNGASSTIAIDGAVMTLCKPLYIDPPLIIYQITKNGNTFIDDASIGSVPWSMPMNAATSNDVYSSATIYLGQSHYLKGTGFGFTIPSTATVQGIVVEWERNGQSMPANAIVDNSVRIVKNGVVGSVDKAKTDIWTTGDQFVSYGSPTDLWGLSWTPADINAVGFGAALSAKTNQFTSMANANADSARITVYYTSP